MARKKIYRRGPVTIDNSIFHKDGSVFCPISTNSHTEDEYFLIDQEDFDLVVGHSWCVENDNAHVGRYHYRISSRISTIKWRLHSYLFYIESIAVGLEVDHLDHFTDNRKCSIDFVTKEENVRRGAAAGHTSKNTRTRKVA